MAKARWGRRAVWALAAVALTCALAALAGCAGGSGAPAASGEGTLRVGVRSDVVGFGYLNKDTNKHYGLEIDLAEELARRLGYADVEFVDVLPETRKDMLLNGEVDCLVACYSVSESRQKNFDFSPVYYEDRSVIMVEDSSLITSLDGLKGRTFGTMSGSNTAPQLVIKLTEAGFTNGEALEANADNSDVRFDTFHLVQVPSYQELSDRLEEGSIDAACMDASLANTFNDFDRSLLDFQIDTQSYAVATQKGSALSQPVAEAVQVMLDDGTVARLIDKWN
ncbi:MULTISPECIES: transporter substrate-binding domain-containing protein [Gordonibacter]|uniref:Transporter substrate-binding domain-containing protein n=1 Tax=Gordonibacter faecis TaxID=3047475 RepID=A0ABT7DMQ5_9ACTN|nr:MULTISPECIES: transporter substrate-binding domain-containing protein [unclassified Gordonibacter]MDJ1650820.1 transporter substrate-binding domain-containing protein [Gordonibacter sp. KGMB12511]HIW77150.1 transporter substrate-binding domain-containing protein [Candidatus Gordonibacter avicola]